MISFLPRAGRRKRILCSDWLPERARWRPYPLRDFPRCSRVPQEKVLSVALCLLFIVNIIILFFCFIELYPARASELERAIGPPPPI